MSVLQQVPDRRMSPGLTLNLSSNNPFRNRATSPTTTPSPSHAAFNIPLSSAPPDRPTSRNPFLDRSEKMDPVPQQNSMSPVKTVVGASVVRSPTKQGPSSNTNELFNNLTLRDDLNGVENVPPRSNGRAVTHRPTRSEEEEESRRRALKQRGPQTAGLDIFADPPAPSREQRRARRNSESSVIDRNSKLLDPDDDRRRRETRHRERELRHRDRKSKHQGSGSKSSTSKKPPNARLDVIDKLDVTSIYGTGLFHHDGPFDACNPHRNRKGSQRAPMQAFPKDSANNVIGGSGPVNKNIDIAQFHGHGSDGFTDYSTKAGGPNAPVEMNTFEPYAGAGAPVRGDARPGIDRTSSFNATAKAEMVHGDESMGLGTSTFLEGAPAARVAIQRRESESEPHGLGGGAGGLGRKKSLAQKIRGIKSGERTDRPRIVSPDPVIEDDEAILRDVQSAGGVARLRGESKPFFNDYDDAYEQKGARIQVAEQQGLMGRARAPSNPMRPAPPIGSLERRTTNDGLGGGLNSAGLNSAGASMDADGKSGGGFLSRVKSLKGGGRRARPERRMADE